MLALSRIRSGFRERSSVARIVSAFLLVGTVATQHPNPMFARLKRMDPLSAAFPNWRFFAPHPAQHDYHIVYRSLSELDISSKWASAEVITRHNFRNIAWFPGRRLEKGIFDIVSELLVDLRQGFDVAGKRPAYRLLRGFIREKITENDSDDCKGFQFGVVKTAGYDAAEPAEIVFVSPYVPISEK